MEWIEVDGRDEGKMERWKEMRTNWEEGGKDGRSVRMDG